MFQLKTNVHNADNTNNNGDGINFTGKMFVKLAIITLH